MVFSLAIAYSLVGIQISATFSQSSQHLFVDAFADENVIIPQRHAEVCSWTGRVGQSGIAGFLSSVLTSWTPELAFGLFGHLCFASRLVAPCHMVLFLSTAFCCFGINFPATIGQSFQHFCVDAFSSENVLVPQSNAELCLGTDRVLQRTIAGFLCGFLASGTPESSSKWFAYNSILTLVSTALLEVIHELRDLAWELHHFKGAVSQIFSVLFISEKTIMFVYQWKCYNNGSALLSV